MHRTGQDEKAYWRVAWHRGSDAGIVLLPTLVAVVLVSGLLTVLVAGDFARLRVVGAALDRDREQLDYLAVHAFQTGPALREMVTGRGRLPLDSSPRTIEREGRRYAVALQDVEGLVDLYLAPPAILAAIGLRPRDVNQMREEAAEFPLGRHPSLDLTIAALGETSQVQWSWITQSANDGRLRRENSPNGLRDVTARVANQYLASGQVQTVEITIFRSP